MAKQKGRGALSAVIPNDMEKAIKITIPENLEFSALKLARDSSTGGDVEFDWAPVKAICDTSGIDISIFRDQSEDNVSQLLTTWYAEHRKRGGDPDPVMEDLIAEIAAEDATGSGISHKPGAA